MMTNIRLAVICPSEIAYRRFMPAIKKIKSIDYVGVGINSLGERYGDNLPEKEIQYATLRRSREKAETFVKSYGGIIFDSYNEVVTSKLIDAIYIPLPPALHFKWAKKALENGKHILLEKPATIFAKDTEFLISIAMKKNLVIHENYMFIYHKQLDDIDTIIKSGEIGEVRLYRVRFGFPRRDEKDFRYHKTAGGGALNDAGGYTIKYATRLLGKSIHVLYAQMSYLDGFEVDMYGSGAFTNDDGIVVQIAYGMDNDYKCELEVWGSKGTLISGRVLTSPAGYIPEAVISKNGDKKIIKLSEDDAFQRSIEKFIECITNTDIRLNNYKHIIKQSQLIEEFRGATK